MLPAVGTNEPIRTLSTLLELQPTRPSPAQAGSLTQRTANQEDTCHSPGCQASETRSLATTVPQTRSRTGPVCGFCNYRSVTRDQFCRSRLRADLPLTTIFD